MKALQKEGGLLRVRSCPPPRLRDGRQVRVRVAVAGLCRTDLYVAQGLLESRDALILGHEFSGLVEEVGHEVEGLRPGQRVAVFPWNGCGSCRWCSQGNATACGQRQMLGLHLDGAFAEEVLVWAHQVFPIPDSMSFQAGSYLEPVAASLAVLKAGLDPNERGLVFGHNRIAELTAKIMRHHGFHGLETGPNEHFPDSSFDWIVETVASPVACREITRLLRPGGHLVLKSRHPRPLQLDLLTIVPKELRMTAVNYGSFQSAIELLRDPSFCVRGLLGEIHPLEDWPVLFDEAGDDESSKRFFGLVNEDVWSR